MFWKKKNQEPAPSGKPVNHLARAETIHHKRLQEENERNRPPCPQLPWACTVGETYEEIGLHEAHGLKERIAKYKGKPGNFPLLWQLLDTNKELFLSEENGERYINVLTFLKEAGGDQWIENCWHMIRTYSPSLPPSARKRAEPLMKDISRQYDEWVASWPQFK